MKKEGEKQVEMWNVRDEIKMNAEVIETTDPIDAATTIRCVLICWLLTCR